MPNGGTWNECSRGRISAVRCIFNDNGMVHQQLFNHKPSNHSLVPYHWNAVEMHSCREWLCIRFFRGSVCQLICPSICLFVRLSDCCPGWMYYFFGLSRSEVIGGQKRSKRHQSGVRPQTHIQYRSNTVITRINKSEPKFTAEGLSQ